jgi:hypothetical protein
MPALARNVTAARLAARLFIGFARSVVDQRPD